MLIVHSRLPHVITRARARAVRMPTMLESSTLCSQETLSCSKLLKPYIKLGKRMCPTTQ